MNDAGQYAYATNTIMSLIDAAEAWAIIRAARHQSPNHDWEARPGLVISPGGGWRAQNNVTPQASWLFDTLLPVAYSATEYVVAQLGQSLDGRIATPTGQSQYITGSLSRIHLHRLRALVDAVVIGANTLIVDDPQLTVRHVPGTNPVRVILDPGGRAPQARRVFTDGRAPTWYLGPADRNLPTGARALTFAAGDATEAAVRIVHMLRAEGLRRILIEGGGTTVSHFLAAGMIDRLHLTVAPLLLGSGRLAFNLPEIDTLDQALHPACRHYALGEDLLFDLQLHPQPKAGAGSPGMTD